MCTPRHMHGDDDVSSKTQVLVVSLHVSKVVQSLSSQSASDEHSANKNGENSCLLLNV